MKMPHLVPRSWVIGALILLALLITACSGNSESWPGISGTADNDSVVVSYKRTIVRLSTEITEEDTIRRTEIWRYKGEDDTDFYAPALIVDDRVYVGDFKGRIHAIDFETGDGIWVYEPERTKFLGFTFGSSERVIAPVSLSNGTLFFGNEGGITALGISDIEGADAPEVAWEFETEHSVWSQPLYLDGEDFGIDPTLIVASLDQHIYGVNPANGSQRWVIDLGGGIPGNITLDRDRQRIYVGTMNNEVVAVSLEGEIVDRFETDGWVWGSPALYNDMLYFGDLSGYIYELELTEDGFGEASQRQLTEDKPVRATPLIVDDAEGRLVLIVGSEDGFIYALNLTWISERSEQLRWKYEADTRAVSELTWISAGEERLIVVGTEESDRMVLALRLNANSTEGERIWSYEYDN